MVWQNNLPSKAVLDRINKQKGRQNFQASFGFLNDFTLNEIEESEIFWKISN